MLKISCDTLTFCKDRDTPQYNQLAITNSSPKRIAFKIQTTSPSCFTVAPSNGFLTPSENIEIIITMIPSEATFNNTHKFQVQAIQTDSSDYMGVEWKDKDRIEVHRILTNMEEKVEIQTFDKIPLVESTQLEPESRVFSHRGTLYLEVEEDELEEFEHKKQGKILKISELTHEIDRLKKDIEKAEHKLRFSENMEDMMKSEAVSGYGYFHLGVAAICGLIFGYLFLN